MFDQSYKRQPPRAMGCQEDSVSIVFGVGIHLEQEDAHEWIDQAGQLVASVLGQGSHVPC